MKRHFKPFFWTIVAMMFTLISPAFADMAPDADSAQDKAESLQSKAESSNTLNQYPATETAPTNINFPKVKTEDDAELAHRFAWWPSDAKPAPYKDPERSGYWWWPTAPGQTTSQDAAWGNQGWIYVRKVIFDYKSETGPMRSSLVIKKIIKNVKVYFDYDKAAIRQDAQDILDQAMGTLDRNPKADILITGNADTRGSEQYNQKLGERRADAVREYLVSAGLPESRIKILSRGKLDALASKGDLVGMQKDRNAQFMIAEVEEVRIPADKAASFGEVPEATQVIEENKKYEGDVKVSVKEYTIQKGDTLWAIAKKEYGDGRQWNRIYEFNKDVIKNPNNPRKGTRIKIPIE